MKPTNIRAHAVAGLSSYFHLTHTQTVFNVKQLEIAAAMIDLYYNQHNWQKKCFCMTLIEYSGI